MLQYYENKFNKISVLAAIKIKLIVSPGSECMLSIANKILLYIICIIIYKGNI
jgi:hypothetical protein